MRMTVFVYSSLRFCQDRGTIEVFQIARKHKTLHRIDTKTHLSYASLSGRFLMEADLMVFTIPCVRQCHDCQDNNINHRVRYSLQPEPPQKSPSRNPESEGRRVSAFVISEGGLVEQNTKRVWYLF